MKNDRLDDNVFRALLTEQINAAARRGSLFLAALGLVGALFILYAELMQWPGNYEMPGLLSLSGMVYALVIHVLARRQLLQGRVIWVVILLFALIPTIYFAITHFFTPFGAITYMHGPIMFVYFFVIVLSGFFFDFWLSTITGFVCGLGIVLCFLILGQEGASRIHIDDPILQSDIAGGPTFFLRAAFMSLIGPTVGALSIISKRLISRLLLEQHAKNEINRLFGQQVSPGVVAALLEGGQQETIREGDATVMFLDIRGFSNWAESRAPAEVIQFQNNFFSPLIEIISAHGGIVNQILGDGFMASFGVPAGQPDHCLQAFRAGREIIAKVATLSASGKIPPTKVGIGLHTGPVVTGNIGNEIRKQFSLAGKTVILAARLEALNKQFATQYLLSEAVQSIVSGEGANLRLIPNVPIKGWEKPQRIYSVE